MTTTNTRFIPEYGLDNNNNTITNIAWPVNSTDLASKTYADQTLIPAAPADFNYSTTVKKIVRSKGSYFIQTYDNRIISWGNNDWGQIGQGSPNAKELASEIMFPYYDQTANILQFECSGSTLYCLYDTGHLYGWGANYAGQLGTGTTTECWQPSLIDTNVEKFWTPPHGNDSYRQSATTVGNASTWYKKTGSSLLYRCGENGVGSLGINSTVNQLTSTSTNTPNGTLVNLWLGEITNPTTWALYNNAGTLTLWCNGYNGTGALGIGSTTNITSWGIPSLSQAILSTIVDIQSGGYNWNGTSGSNAQFTVITCWDGTNVKIYTSGYNASGQLGRLSPTQQTTFGLAYTGPNNVGWVKTVKTYANTWVLLADGSYVHWGDNSVRQLNPANTTDITTPTRVVPTYPITDIFVSNRIISAYNPLVFFYSKTNPNVLTVRGYNVSGCAGIGNLFINAAMTSDQYPMIDTLGYDIADILMTSPNTLSSATILVQFKNSTRLLFAGDSNDYESNTTLTTSKYAFCSLLLGNILGR